MEYKDFLKNKRFVLESSGFDIDKSELNPMLYDFQKDIVRWALKKGKACIFADCGLGKTPMQLSWAHQVHKHMNSGKILIIAPLAVSEQTKREAEKFGYVAKIVSCQEDCVDGINITNYEKLDHFVAKEFVGIVLDESSILKSYSGKVRTDIINNFHDVPYKLACTATPAPNDYMEIGNHSEFCGVMTRSEMLSMFFVHDGGETSKWRLKGHAVDVFWQWLATFSVFVDNPKNIGYLVDGYDLPDLRIHEICVDADEPYVYEKSIRKVKHDRDAEQKRQLENYIRRKKGRYCVWHAQYDFWTKEWKQRYDPMQCARMCQNIGKTCTLTGKEISKKRGNVFYDVKVSWIHNEGDLFDGQEEVHITRGVRFLDHPTSITICEQIAKRCRQEIVYKETHMRHVDIFLNGMKVEVFNIRVEQRESRDLLQDLADLQAGIKISYDSDDKKAAKEAKSARRKEAKEARIRRMEKRILEVGYDNFDDLEKNRALKVLDYDRIEELEAERIKQMQEKENEPKQLTLFDLGVM